MTAEQSIDRAVVEAVTEALGLMPDEITPDSRLIDDLGAESIDLLDMLFRIEQGTGVKVQAGELIEEIQGGIPEDEFGDADGIITARGLAHLKTVMPQIDAAALAGTLKAQQVITLFTVRNLADMVKRRVCVAAS